MEFFSFNSTIVAKKLCSTDSKWIPYSMDTCNTRCIKITLVNLPLTIPIYSYVTHHRNSTLLESSLVLLSSSVTFMTYPNRLLLILAIKFLLCLYSIHVSQENIITNLELVQPFYVPNFLYLN